MKFVVVFVGLSWWAIAIAGPVSGQQVAVVSDDRDIDVVGNWGLVMPDGAAGWLSIRQDASNKELRGELWSVGRSRGMRQLRYADGELTFQRSLSVGKPEYPGGRPTGPKVPVEHRAAVHQDRIHIVMMRPTGAGNVEKVAFEGQRLSPVPPQPDLSQVTFGEPIELFNGRDLSGWSLTNPDQLNGWEAKDGELVNTTPKLNFDPFSRYGNLRTDREFEDFRLQLEFNVPPGGNSGVYLRGRYEAQVVDRDSRMQGIQGVGAIFSRIAPASNAGRPGGQWQSYDITLVDRHATVILNGIKVIDNQPIVGCTNGALSAVDDAPGPIYLQGDHTAVRYRNLILHPVIKSPATDQSTDRPAGQPATNPRQDARPSLPPGVVAHRNLTYVANGHPRQTLDLYLPDLATTDSSLPLVVWVHGGGWWKGSKESIHRQSFLLEEGFALASINYRLTGHEAFPAQIHDCKAAIRYLRKHAAQYGVDPRRIGVWGSSAGGHLVALLGTSGDVAELEGEVGTSGVSSRVQAVCDWYGPIDLQHTDGRSSNPKFQDVDVMQHPLPRLLGGLPSEKPELARQASPTTWISADDPPFLIMHGLEDPLVSDQHSRLLQRRLTEAGVSARLLTFPNHGHSFFSSADQRQTVIDFFQRQLRRDPADD